MELKHMVDAGMTPIDARIEGIFTKTGMDEAGQALLDRINREIVELNNRGVMAARSGDLEGAVTMLIEAANRVPNLQFLVNAAKAIFTLLDQRGWDSTLGDQAVRFLERAQAREALNPKVVSARELYQRVARKYGISPVPLTKARNAKEEEAVDGE